MAGKKAKARRGTAGTPKKGRAARWVGPFLAALAQTGNVSAAATQGGVPRRTAYNHRGAVKSFAEAWDEALEVACDALELEARRRAQEGVRRLKFHQGDPVMVPALGPGGLPLRDANGEPVLVPYVEHEYSDTLMIFLLKAHRPKKFRENVRHEHTGDGGGPVLFDLDSLRRLPDDELSRLYHQTLPPPPAG
jgi:hypothetical protein